LIAGPCSAESREQLMEAARALSALGADTFRAGMWKPRSHPDAFGGVGAEGLEWLSEVRRSTGMKVATEVAGAKHVEACLKYGVDVLWLGARTTANPFLVQEIADALKGSGVEVMIKNPVNPDIGLWTGAVERIENAGIRNKSLVFRGFSSASEYKYRNAPIWSAAVKMRTLFPGLPLYCDPSHIGGKAEYVQEIAQKALNLGFDGLMVECQDDPSSAKSDPVQQLSPGELRSMLASLLLPSCGSDALALENLRAEIDELDSNILAALARRMEVSRRIGKFKKDNNIAIIHASRWEKVLNDVLEQAGKMNMDKDCVRAVFSAIHEASVREQENI